MRCDGLFYGCGVAERDDFKSRRKGAESVPILVFGAESDNGDGPAMKIVFTDDDFSFVMGNTFDLISPFSNRFDNGFNGVFAGYPGAWRPFLPAARAEYSGIVRILG